MTGAQHLAYSLLWLSFGLVHSLLAGERMKHRLGSWLSSGYRLAYNVVAAIHVALILLAGRNWFSAGTVDFGWSPATHTMLDVAQWTGVAIIAIALLHYDLGRFSGLTQLLTGYSDSFADAEPLHVSGLHRYVRHPLYAGAYLYLWSRVGNEFELATAIWASAYLALGTRFEERRLEACYGHAYADYRKRVPALIPWKGRALL